MMMGMDNDDDNDHHDDETLILIYLNFMSFDMNSTIIS